MAFERVQSSGFSDNKKRSCCCPRHPFFTQQYIIQRESVLLRDFSSFKKSYALILFSCCREDPAAAHTFPLLFFFPSTRALGVMHLLLVARILIQSTFIRPNLMINKLSME